MKNTPFDWNKPTVMLLGRYQPWHGGHQALFDEAIKKTGQVAILVRDTEGIDEDNPYSWETVLANIYLALDEKYTRNQYIILSVPNITNIIYGRKVGYEIEQIHLDQEIEAISATKIRNSIECKDCGADGVPIKLCHNCGREVCGKCTWMAHRFGECKGVIR